MMDVNARSEQGLKLINRTDSTKKTKEKYALSFLRHADGSIKFWDASASKSAR